MAPSMYVFNVFTFLNAVVPPRKKDIVGDLPPEMGCSILRLLDTDSLVNVVLVSPRWRDLCLCDPVLSKRIRCYLEETRRLKKENRKIDRRVRTVRSLYLSSVKRNSTERTNKSKRKQPDDSKIVEPLTKKRPLRM